MDTKPENNIIFTQTEKLMMNGKPKSPTYARNKNVLVIGGSGSGKTRFFVKPNLMQCHSSYVVTDPKGNTFIDRSQKWSMLREKSNLKEMYIVRYADDFKIFCHDYNTARKTYIAVVKWLKERLHLDINLEKSGITNLEKNYMEFLGLKIKAIPKRNKYAVKSFMSDKAYKNAHMKVKESIKKVLNLNDQESINKNIGYYNSLVAGLHNYYKMATHVSRDFSKIGHPVRIRLSAINHNNKGCTISKTGDITSKFIVEKYGKSQQLRWIGSRVIIPISYVQHEYPKYKRREVNKYAIKNDKEYSVPNSINIEIIKYLMESAYKWESIEFADNMLSRYIAQKGNCAVLHKPLYLHNMECHHIKPRKYGFADNNTYQNLVILTTEVHRLIHAANEKTICRYLDKIKSNEEQLRKINKFRKHAGKEIIKI